MRLSFCEIGAGGLWPRPSEDNIRARKRHARRPCGSGICARHVVFGVVRERRSLHVPVDVSAGRQGLLAYVGLRQGNHFEAPDTA
jgi:hypothetical protein